MNENPNEVKKQNIDLLCDNCGEAFSNFLQEMADQNAKVAACPKCGKIHSSTPMKSEKATAGASPKKI